MPAPTDKVGDERLLGLAQYLGKFLSHLSEPRHNTEREARALKGKKERQRHHYDKHTKPLTPISLGQTVRMKLPGQRKWSAGTYAGKVDELSYIVKVGDVEYQGNRKQLVSGHEDPLTELADPSELTLSRVTHEVQPLATYIASERVAVINLLHLKTPQFLLHFLWGIIWNHVATT